MKLILAAVFAISLTACAVQQPAMPSENANYGTYPQTSQTFGAVAFMGELKDPDSAIYQFSKPRKAYLTNNRGTAVAWTGYAIPVAVNSKNSFGAYAGYTPYVVLVNDGEIKMILRGTGHRNLRYMSPIPTEELEQQSGAVALPVPDSSAR